MTSAESATSLDTVDINRIVELIPHRYPFLLIDKVVGLNPGESATGIKNVTINEPFFAGHFPDHPIMPGVLIVEAMAQTAAVLVCHSLGDEREGKPVYFMSIDGVRFRKPVVPGDTLKLDVALVHRRGPVAKFEGKARVGDTLVSEARFAAMITDGD